MEPLSAIVLVVPRLVFAEIYSRPLGIRYVGTNILPTYLPTYCTSCTYLPYLGHPEQPPPLSSPFSLYFVTLPAPLDTPVHPHPSIYS